MLIYVPGVKQTVINMRYDLHTSVLIHWALNGKAMEFTLLGAVMGYPNQDIHCMTDLIYHSTTFAFLSMYYSKVAHSRKRVKWP